MNVRRVFASNLKHFRTERGLSQEALADLADLHRTYISAIERQVYAVSIDKLAAIAAILGIEPYRLLKPNRGP